MFGQKSFCFAFVWCVILGFVLASLFGGLRHRFRRILESFWKVFWSNFVNFLQHAANLQKCNHYGAECMVLDVLGFHFCIIFANFFELFFVLLSGLHFYSILADFDFQVGFMLGSILADFADFA